VPVETEIMHDLGVTFRRHHTFTRQKHDGVAERTKAYEQAQLIFKKEAPWNTLDNSLVFVPMSKKVSGFFMDPLGIHSFDGVDI
ncbi:hypothetical protein ACC739_37395, partial [Rhizobium ruizarguesonis]